MAWRLAKRSVGRDIRREVGSQLFGLRVVGIREVGRALGWQKGGPH